MTQIEKFEQLTVDSKMEVISLLALLLADQSENQ